MLLVALLAAAALPANAARPKIDKLDDDPRAVVPAAPDACTAQMRKGTAWGVATAAYQVRVKRGTALVRHAVACNLGVNGASRPPPLAHRTDRGRVERQRAHAERLGCVRAHSRWVHPLCCVSQATRGGCVASLGEQTSATDAAQGADGADLPRLQTNQHQP
jgi:hypothetical protein